MSELYKIIKNLDSVTRKFGGQFITAGNTYTISDPEGLLVAQDDLVLHNALTEDTPEAAMVDPANTSNIITGMDAVRYLLNMDEPKNTDARRIQHSTPRPLGTFTYFTSADDDHTDPHAIGGTSNITESLIQHPSSGGNNPEVKYLDFNTIINDTYIRQGDLLWNNAVFDYVNLQIVPKVTTTSSGSNTNYDVVNGVIIPAAGDGSTTVNDADRVLVQNVPNEYGDYPAGYWDADWNTSTKQFENITPNTDGDGAYNMFSSEVVLFTFVNRKIVNGSSNMVCPTNDVSKLGHNMRVKISAHTRGTDHAWDFAVTFMLYRAKTV